MAMEDILPAILVIAVLWVVYKWLFGSKSNRPDNSRDSIRGVTASMVDSVHSAFPHIPVPNIIYHLSKTRSSQATSEEIIEKGFLPAPPASFHIPSSLLPPTVNPPSQPTSPVVSTSSTLPGKSISLIERYGLVSRVASRKGKEKVEIPVETAAAPSSGGKASWGDTKEKREMELKERKAKMILEARRRLLEKENQAAAAA